MTIVIVKNWKYITKLMPAFVTYKNMASNNIVYVEWDVFDARMQEKLNLYASSYA